MENLLRAALLDWLRTAKSLGGLNAIEEESPLRTAPPWLGIATHTSSDWSTKDRAGREVRIAWELVTRSDAPGSDAAWIRAIERRLENLPPVQAGFEVISVRFLRARAERRSNNLRAALLEYRFRILATP